jgi:hydroxypyruvate isomerase
MPSMPRFAPNLMHLFQELPERERVPAVAELGFDAVEWIFPYALKKEEVARICKGNGVTISYGLVPADWAGNNWGWSGRLGCQDQFRRAADTAIEYAIAAGYDTIQVGHGKIQPGESRERSIDTVVENLAYICAQAKGQPFRIVIEPVCTRNNEPFVLSTMAQGKAVLDRVKADNLWLVWDTFHLTIEEPGSLAVILDTYRPQIGYAQIGNLPDRTGPETGELDLYWISERIWSLNCTKWIGLEFGPANGQDSWDALAWCARYGYPVKPRSKTRFAV